MSSSGTLVLYLHACTSGLAFTGSQLRVGPGRQARGAKGAVRRERDFTVKRLLTVVNHFTFYIGVKVTCKIYNFTGCGYMAVT